MAEPTRAEQMEQVVRTYIQACNDADADAIAQCFTVDAVHYSPVFPKWSGAATIAENFQAMVKERGFRWTVDQLLIDIERSATALEWTMFANREPRPVLRGVDWIVFEPQKLRILEIRPYMAGRLDAGPRELRDFDYAGRGYPT